MDQNISRKAAYGSFLIIPLKYDPDSLDLKRIEQIGTGLSITTMDLNENVKAMLTPSDPASIGSGWMIRSGELSASLCSQAAGTPCTGFQVADDTGCFDFELNDSWLYVFHTRTAFLCLSLSFRQMETLETICNPGWAYNPDSRLKDTLLEGRDGQPASFFDRSMAVRFSEPAGTSQIL